MKNLQIALLQLLPGGSLEKNLEIGLAACRKAKTMGADLALFPEMWSSGYTIPQDPEALNTLAIEADSAFVRAFSDLAGELNMAIGITLLERFQPSPRNTLILFDRFGRRVLTYAKVHTCDFGDERVLTRGEDFPVAELDTEVGTVRVGGMICYDREFPESARLLMLGGAEVILVPNACPMEINRISQLRARAYENMTVISTCNYPKGQPDCNGHSTVFDGVAYREEEPGSRDTPVIEAGEAEGIYLASIDLDELRDYRSREVHGNAFRRPELYHKLISEQIEPPFMRKEKRN